MLVQCVNLTLQDGDARVVVSSNDPQHRTADDRHRRQ
jgi:hypothetical protein